MAGRSYPRAVRLYKRGPVWWARWTEDGVTRRKSTKCADRIAAQLVLRKWERQRADPDHAASNQATVASAAARFLKELVRERVADGTLNMYRCKVGHVVRLLGSVHLVELDHGRVVRFVDEREREGAHSHTVHRELTALRRVLQSAQRAREFARDPRSVLPRYSSGYVPRTRYLSCFEFAAVCGHLAPERAAMLCFIVATGARRGEAVRAERADVGADRVVLRGTKTARSRRVVPIPRLFRGLVEQATRDADGPSPLLFRTWGNMRRDIAAACVRAGCDPFTANDLRRTTGTWLLQLGVPMEVVAKVLGHASTAMLFRVYGQLGADDLGRLIDARLL